MRPVSEQIQLRPFTDHYKESKYTLNYERYSSGRHRSRHDYDSSEDDIRRRRYKRRPERRYRYSRHDSDYDNRSHSSFDSNNSYKDKRYSHYRYHKSSKSKYRRDSAQKYEHSYKN